MHNIFHGWDGWAIFFMAGQYSSCLGLLKNIFQHWDRTESNILRTGMNGQQYPELLWMGNFLVMCPGMGEHHLSVLDG